jgi:hypothetical protein
MLQRATQKLLKAVRRNKPMEHRDKLRGEIIGWVAAIGNRLSIQLGTELLNHFPGVCSYCDQNPCNPNLHGQQGRMDVRHRLAAPALAGVQIRQTFCADQRMMAGIYPNNTLVDSVQHLTEEAGEVAVAIHAYERMHESGRRTDDRRFNHICLELADVIANACAEATCDKVNLCELVVAMFADGCPGCTNPVCDCPFSYIVEAD